MLVNSQHKRLTQTLLLILALLPLLLSAYLGSHARMVSDDYCHAAVARELAPWQAVLHWRDTWNGSYTDYLVYSLLAPLGITTPMVAPALIIIAWLFALTALMYRGAGILKHGQLPFLSAIALAAFVIAVSIDAFLSPQSLYFYSAATRHTLPIVGFTAFFALMAVVSQSQVSSVRGAVAGAALCFVNAGLSESFAVLQSVILGALLLTLVALPQPAIGRGWRVLTACGILATLAALGIMATAPGAAVRTEILPTSPYAQNLDLTSAIAKSVGAVLYHFRDPEIIKGFVAALAFGLYLSLGRRRQAAAKSSQSVDSAIARSRVLFVIAFQLICLPFLWAQASDNPQVFGRCSLAYSTIILLNLALIAGLALLLVMRARVNDILARRPDISVVAASSALSIALLLFTITQLRTVDWRVASYLHASILMLCLALTWQFTSSLPALVSRRFSTILGCWYMIAFAASTTVILFSNLIAGTYWPRILGFFPFAFIFPAILWAAYLGYAMTRFAASSPPTVAAIKSLQLVSLAVALIIGAKVVTSQANLIPLFQQHSDAWDSRHQRIIDSREQGQRSVIVAPITFSLAHYMRSQQLHRTHCPLQYYTLCEIDLPEMG